MVDGWGARHYLTRRSSAISSTAACSSSSTVPRSAPWQFRSHRLRRLHRKLCHVDGKVAFVGGINVIDDMHTPGHKPPRVDFAVRVEGPLLPHVVRTMQRVWAINELVQSGSTAGAAVSAAAARRARGRADREVRDPRQPAPSPRHRAVAISPAIRIAKREILIANSYFFPGVTFRRALIAAAAARRQGHAAAAGARRDPPAALRDARALRPAAAGGHRDPGIPPLVPAREGGRHRRPWCDRRLVEHRSVQPADGARGQRVRARSVFRGAAARRARCR